MRKAPSAKEVKAKVQAFGGKAFELPWFKETPTLSKQESQALKEPLEAALSDYFGHMDEYIWYKTQDEQQMPVWSDVDQEEVEVLARMMLRRGERSAAAASMVRATVNSSDLISTALILIPRITKTADRLAKAPKRRNANAPQH